MSTIADRAKTIFLEAVAIDELPERTAFLDEACGSDIQLRQRVDRLIDAHEQEDSLFDRTEGLPGPAAEQPGDQMGPYKIREVIGEGGMGTVYVAEQQRPIRRKVALKVIKPEFEGDKKVKHRFHREAKLHAQVQNHPRWVVPIHVYDKFEEIPYIIMPYLPAGSLMGLVQRYAPLSNQVVAKIILELANGLTVTEQAALVHRDIKPSNILLQPNGYIGLSDFGMAAYEQKSAARSVAGTPGYMAPEQFVKGHGQDVRSDIFSLGCTLHYLLCGSSPFGDTVQGVLAAHSKLKQGALPKLERSEVSSHLLELRNKALQYEIEDRFQTSEEVAVFVRNAFERDFLDSGLFELKGFVDQTLQSKKEENLETLAETEEFRQD